MIDACFYVYVWIHHQWKSSNRFIWIRCDFRWFGCQRNREMYVQKVDGFVFIATFYICMWHWFAFFISLLFQWRDITFVHRENFSDICYWFFLFSHGNMAFWSWWNEFPVTGVNFWLGLMRFRTFLAFRVRRIYYSEVIWTYVNVTQQTVWQLAYIFFLVRVYEHFHEIKSNIHFTRQAYVYCLFASTAFASIGRIWNSRHLINVCSSKYLYFQ